MTNNAAVSTGPQMTPAEETAHRRRLAEQYADEADQAVETIRAKLDGVKETLATAEAEAERLRAEANELADADAGADVEDGEG